MTGSGRRLRVWLPAVRSGSGADVYTERLAAGLERAGHEPILQWFPHYYELTPWRLKRIAPPAGTDIITANSWQGFAFKRKELPLVVIEHHFVLDPAFDPYRTFQQKIYHELFISGWLERSYRSADTIVAVSEHTAVAVKSKLGFNPIVIYNWLSIDQYLEPVIKTDPEGGCGRPFRLLFVGNPSRRKGADLLPKLARELGNGFEIWCLGGLRKNFQRLSKFRDLVLLPRVSPHEMPRIYAQVDAVLVPARYEAFGYVALEAMACGKPVVGFANSGIREVCVDNETAELCQTENLECLAAACRRLMEDPALAHRMGLSGQLRARMVFDEARAMAAYTEIYKSLTD